MIAKGARWTAGWVIVGTAMLVSGCTNDADGGSAEPSASASGASPTPSAVASPPFPSDGSERSAEGATAFVRHWFDLVNYGFQTGDAAPMLALADSACSACRDLDGKIRELHGGGRHVAGQALSLDDVVAPAPTGQTLIVAAAYRTAPHQLVEADGSVVEVPSDEPTTAGVVLAWENERWLLVDLGRS